MSLWRQLTRGLRVLTNRTAADQDVAEVVNKIPAQDAAIQRRDEIAGLQSGLLAVVDGHEPAAADRFDVDLRL